jgi:hypothetical protein
MTLQEEIEHIFATKTYTKEGMAEPKEHKIPNKVMDILELIKRRERAAFEAAREEDAHGFGHYFQVYSEFEDYQSSEDYNQ